MKIQKQANQHKTGNCLRLLVLKITLFSNTIFCGACCINCLPLLILSWWAHLMKLWYSYDHFCWLLEGINVLTTHNCFYSNQNTHLWNCPTPYTNKTTQAIGLRHYYHLLLLQCTMHWFLIGPKMLWIVGAHLQYFAFWWYPCWVLMFCFLLQSLYPGWVGLAQD